MSRVSINVSCKDCLFYNKLINNNQKNLCKDLGFLSYCRACDNFTINVQDIDFLNCENRDFLNYIRKIPTSKLSELAALIVQEGYNRQSNWSIGDIAYYNIGKSDYISSYVQVIFKGLVANTNLAVIESNKNNQETWIGIVELKFLLNLNQWREKHKELLSNNQVVDDNIKKVLPNFNIELEENMRKEDYVPKNFIYFLKN